MWIRHLKGGKKKKLGHETARVLTCLEYSSAQNWPATPLPNERKRKK